MRQFRPHEIEMVSDALDIAEDVTANHYRFSVHQWKRLSYDIKTLFSLDADEVTDGVFALLNRGMRVADSHDPGSRWRDFYFICLQDHQILRALNRDRRLGLFPLLLYVLTHELIHVVRFRNYQQRFNLAVEEREKEESIVHGTTYEILKGLSMAKMDYVLDSYRNHRMCSVAL